MNRYAFAFVSASILAAIPFLTADCGRCGIGDTSTTGSGGGGAGGAAASSSNASTGSGGLGGGPVTSSSAGTGGEMNLICKSSSDCPASFPGQAICTRVACDPTGKQTEPGATLPGCHVVPVALFTECFINCPGFCMGDGPGGGGTPPWTCVYPPNSDCLDAGADAN